MKSFGTNCTLPPDGVGFVSSPNTRGTLDILWTCLSVLLICTWSILHLNVPMQSTPNGKAQKYLRSAHRLFWKLMWMMANVIAPEWPFGKAWADYLSVSSVEKRFEELKEEDQVHWSRTHCYFANMGGIAIKFEESTKTSPKMPHETSTVNETHDQPNTPEPTPNSTPHETQSPTDNTGTGISSNEATTSPSLQPVNEEPVVTTPVISHQIGIHPGNVPKEAVSSRNSEQDVGHEVESIPTESPVNNNLKDVPIGGDSLPESVKRQLIIILNGRTSPDARKTRLSVMGSSRQIGLVDWTPDETNMALVSQALQKLAFSDFGSDWEKARFASSLYHWLCNLTLLGGDLWVLDANQILLARELGILEQLPSLYEDDVEDRNKGDLFVKIVAVVQIGWFFIQMGARLKKGFATSQLEILTLAYAICTAITYLLLLDQPKDVQYSVIISATRYPTYKELIRLAAVGPTSFWQPRKNVWIPNTAVHADTRRFGAGRDTTLAMGTAFAVFLLGSLHCVAWEFVFPTEVERTLWRASSIITALAMPAGLATNMIVRSIWNCACGSRVSGTFVRPRAQNAATGFSDLTFALIFVAARIFTIVEVLRSLAFLPSDAFVTTWSSNLPHIGS